MPPCVVHRLGEITTALLASNSITLQNGVLNRITGNFTVQNDLPHPGHDPEMRIRQTGTTQWINDLSNDTFINVAPGITSVKPHVYRPALHSGSSNAYDVIFEIGDPDFNGADRQQPAEQRTHYHQPVPCLTRPCRSLCTTTSTRRRRAVTG